MKLRIRVHYLIVVILVILLAAIILGPASGQREHPRWSINAMACVPNGESARAGMVDTSHGHARYASGKTGRMYLICPVTRASLHGSRVRSISMTAQTSGSGAVDAALRYVNHAGSVDNALGVSTNDNCLFSGTNPWVACSRAGFNHQLDFNLYSYYVQISFNRNRANDEASVIMVSFE